MKVNCSSCLEPLEFAENLANSVQKCPTCNNSVQIPEAPKKAIAPSPEKTIEVAAPAPKARRKEITREREPDRRREKPESRFSFRILGTVLLLTVFLIASLVVSAGAIAFYLKDYDTEVMVELQSAFFEKVALIKKVDYTPLIAAKVIGTALVSALLAFVALISVCRRKRITAIIMLTLLIAIGFVVSTPIAPILCLILVSVPGRSDVWARA